MKIYSRWVSIAVLCGLVCVHPSGCLAQEDGAAMSATAPASDGDAFGVLDLETAVAASLTANPGLDAAMERVRQAKARVNQARATYWPWLDATASGSRVKLSENTYQENLATARFFNPAATVEDPQEYYNADLTASWTLFDGFERKFANLAARYDEQSSQASLNDARRLLVSAVAVAYFTAQLALENITIARADEAFNDRLLADAEARQRAGTGALSDVLNFQVRKNQAKTTRINQEYQYAIARFGLAALMGLPESRLPDHVRLAPLEPETATELATPAPDALIAEVRERRPDIQAIRWSIRQAEARIDIARSGNYPSVVLSGSIDGARSDNPRFGEDDFGNQVQVGLTYNLFSGGLTKARISEAQHYRMELEKQLEDLLLSVSADIRSTAARVSSAQAQVALQRENTALVQRTRDLVEKEYLAGQGSLVRLNEAQRDLITARSNLALALVSLRQAWIELKTRSGTLLAAYMNASGKINE